MNLMVRRNVFANLMSSAWGALLNLVMVPVYLHYLGVEALGLIGFFVSVQAWIALLDLGLAPTMNREMSRLLAGQRTPLQILDLFKSVETVFVVVSIVTAFGLGFAASWITANWLQPHRLVSTVVAEAIAIMGLTVACQWMSSLYRNCILGLQDQAWLGAAAAAVVGMRAVVTWIVLAQFTPTVVAFAICQCVFGALEATLFAWHVRRKLPYASRKPQFSWGALLEIRGFATELAAIAVLAALLTQADKLLLAKLLPLDQYGYFSLAVAVAGALSVLIGPIHNAAYPRLSQLAAAAGEQVIAREYHQFAQWMSASLLPAALVLSVFSEEIVLLWTGDPVTAREVAPIVSIWALGTALNGVMHIPYAAQLAYGWVRLALLMNAAAAAVLIPATLWWVPRHGAIAAAWIWTCVNGAFVVFWITLMHKRILSKEKWRWYREDLLAPLVAATLVVACFAVARRQIALGTTGELIFLATTLAATTISAAFATVAGRAVMREALIRIRWRSPAP